MLMEQHLSHLDFDQDALTIDGTTLEEWSRTYVGRGKRTRKRLCATYGEAHLQAIDSLSRMLRDMLKLLTGSTQTRHIANGKRKIKKGASVNHSIVVASTTSKGPPLSGLSNELRVSLFRMAKRSAWLRRVQLRVLRQKGGDTLTTETELRLHNENCPYTAEPIPEMFQVFYGVRREGTGSASSAISIDVTPITDWNVLDVRVLYGKAIQKNPLTNLAFTREFMDLFNARAKHLRQRGYSLAHELAPDTQHAIKRKERAVPTQDSVRQRMLDVAFALNERGYLVGVDMLSNLTDSELADWYFHCHDILTYRSRLTFQQQREILPSGSMFEHHTTIRRDRWHEHHTSLDLQYEVWDMMDRLMTSAHVSHQKETGTHFVIMALTLCSEVFRSHEQFRVFAEAAEMTIVGDGE